MKIPPRHLTPEEKRLWKLVTKNDTRLYENDSEEEEAPTPVKSAKQAAKIKVKRTDTMPVQSKIQKPEAIRSTGEYAGIDRNTAEKFRKGHYVIDAMLDLHGMTSDKAFTALVRFVRSHSSRGNRCLLIITGKGVKGEGVLKKSLPLWLSHDDLSPMILTFDVAKAKHGGGGAFYVLLRRIR